MTEFQKLFPHICAHKNRNIYPWIFCPRQITVFFFNGQIHFLCADGQSIKCQNSELLHLKRESSAKPYDAKKSCWVPCPKDGYVLGEIRGAKGDQITVFAGKKVCCTYSSNKVQGKNCYAGTILEKLMH